MRDDDDELDYDLRSAAEAAQLDDERRRREAELGYKEYENLRPTENTTNVIQKHQD